MAASTLYTVGHSNRSLAELIELLQENDIELCVDVRRYPGSRHNPQFNRATFAEELASRGIEYAHEPSLGGMRDAEADSKNVALTNDAFRAYADHMASRLFRRVWERVSERCRTRRGAVMCAEANPANCHRSLIADLACAQDWRVVHVLGPGSTAEHRSHPAARLGADGTLAYPGENTPEQASLFD